MSNPPAATPEPNDLVISRLVRAPRAKLWRAWTDPQLLKEWWCPRPWTTEVRAFDLRPGGAFHTFMQGPDGGTSDNPGSFLEIVETSRIVFTTVLTAGWRPQTAWMPITAIITMADEAGGTRYTATVMHPDKATRDRHEELGFFDGWGTCITQLEALAQRLPDQHASPEF
ncbi:SRPBCC family protein [Ideonella sp.]|uniref:SRPBCC family protein n=1 Tax=Ideonella sp. TaxID=1929293 RepID=UPI0035ADF7EC